MKPDLLDFPVHRLREAIEVVRAAMEMTADQAKAAKAKHGIVCKEFLNPLQWAESCAATEELLQKVLDVQEGK